jgi:1-acyl-sn-glycerol-3-phosphate acyltransferase
MSVLRAGSIIAGFAVLTLPLMPLQALLVRAHPRWARKLPHWYHRQVCRLFGVRLEIDGAVMRDRPVLFVANHTSWLDITVLSAVAPLSFVAKKEVGTWPFVASLARLQRTVFVDRDRRVSVGDTASEILERLAAGDNVVLFAEGTSSDGNRVLPFKTSLFAAAKPSVRLGGAAPDAVVQTLSLVYTRLNGVPLGRADRPLVGWYGDMEMTSHAWQLLKAGTLDVRIRVGAPVPLSDYADRKDLARRSEDEIRQNVVGILRARRPGEPVVATTPSDELLRATRNRPRPVAGSAATQRTKWT